MFATIATVLPAYVVGDDDDDDGDEGGRDDFRDTPDTTRLWETISRKDNEGLMELLLRAKSLGQNLATARSADGRGAAWWAWEYGNVQALALLQAFGDDINKKDEDLKGNSAISMCEQAGEDCASMSEQAKAAVDGVKKDIEEREKKQKEAEESQEFDVDDNDDDDYDDDEF